MINIKHLNLHFGSRALFNNISCTINQSVRMGLVGLNGSGKSTLLKAIAGKQSYDSGTIACLPGKKIAYMPQDVVLQSDKAIIDEALSACADVTSLQKRCVQLEQKIENGETDDPIINEYVQLQEQLSCLEPAKLRVEAERILTGLGFKSEQMEVPVNSLSVGWKMRIVLAKLLLQKADFYLFDEPTNHLDIVAKDWFMQFLKDANFGFMLVCHERYFLDQLCTSILALENGKAKVYNGNYSDYQEQYAIDLEQLEAAYIQQQKDIKRKEQTIARFRASASKAKMAQSMQKQLDRMERITLPPSNKKVHFHFPKTRRTGRKVLETENVSHAYGQKLLFEQVNLQIERGQKVSLIAANGVGKTTLFNLIVGNLSLGHGSIDFGANVDYAIFAQDQNEALDLNATIFENAQQQCSHKSEQEIRSFLGAFLFSADDIEKKVSVLSGGEKNRVAMALVLMQDANFLLLDEPTNHLDMPSKEILIQALNNFDGTIFFVSHDHYFINQLATHVVALDTHGAHVYEGNYDAYLAQTQHQQSNQNIQQRDTQSDAPAANVKVHNKQERKEIRKLERSIEKMEKEIAKAEHAFASLSYGTPSFDQAQEKLRELNTQLEQLFEQWSAKQGSC